MSRAQLLEFLLTVIIIQVSAPARRVLYLSCITFEITLTVWVVVLASAE